MRIHRVQTLQTLETLGSIVRGEDDEFDDFSEEERTSPELEFSLSQPLLSPEQNDIRALQDEQRTFSSIQKDLSIELTPLAKPPALQTALGPLYALQKASCSEGDLREMWRVYRKYSDVKGSYANISLNFSEGEDLLSRITYLGSVLEEIKLKREASLMCLESLEWFKKTMISKASTLSLLKASLNHIKEDLQPNIQRKHRFVYNLFPEGAFTIDSKQLIQKAMRFCNLQENLNDWEVQFYSALSITARLMKCVLSTRTIFSRMLASGNESFRVESVN